MLASWKLVWSLQWHNFVRWNKSRRPASKGAGQALTTTDCIPVFGLLACLGVSVDCHHKSPVYEINPILSLLRKDPSSRKLCVFLPNRSASRRAQRHLQKQQLRKYCRGGAHESNEYMHPQLRTHCGWSIIKLHCIYLWMLGNIHYNYYYIIIYYMYIYIYILI